MKTVASVVLFAVAVYVVVTPVSAARPGFGMLYYNGEVVRTIVPPAAFPKECRDNFYMVTNGVQGQLGVAAVAPGSTDYHGGQWKVYRVAFNSGVTSYLLTSEATVQAASAAGDVTMTRVPEADFLCPIQP